jgi:hypothetical protein
MDIIISFIAGAVISFFGFRLFAVKVSAFTIREADMISRELEAIKETSSTQYMRLRAEWEYIMSTAGKDLTRASINMMEIIHKVQGK